jgi:hypothetical protein
MRKDGEWRDKEVYDGIKEFTPCKPLKNFPGGKSSIPGN